MIGSLKWSPEFSSRDILPSLTIIVFSQGDTIVQDEKKTMNKNTPVIIAAATLNGFVNPFESVNISKKVKNKN
jgi:hypothetical protein